MSADTTPVPVREPLMQLTQAGPIHAALPVLAMDPALARTLTEHVHCGEPMQVITAGDLPVTAPLTVLLPGKAASEPAKPDTRMYRCGCGFTLDAPGPS